MDLLKKLERRGKRVLRSLIQFRRMSITHHFFCEKGERDEERCVSVPFPSQEREGWPLLSSPPFLLRPARALPWMEMEGKRRRRNGRTQFSLAHFSTLHSPPSLLRFILSFRNNTSVGGGFAVLKTLPILRLLPPNVCARNVFD